MLSFRRVVAGAIGIGTSRFLTGSAVFTASFPQFLRRETPNSNYHKFCTVATLSSVDVKLVTALKSEIKSQRLSMEQTMPVAPADFPFTINIDGRKEKGKLTREVDGKIYGELTREVDGEKIYVSIAMPETIVEDLSSCPNSGACLPEMLILCVKIGKENVKFVDFGVLLCPHVMQVLSMAVSESDDDALRLHDVEKEGELQSALQEYLKMRGIKTCYAEFMYKYMVWLSKQSRLTFLTKLNKFIKD